MAKTTIRDTEIIDLKKIGDRRGNLSIIEENNEIPFEIKRVSWIYDVPSGEERGAHAFKKNKEFIVALSGSFDVVIYDGVEEKKYSLNRSYYGLYLPEGIWRRMSDFSTNSVALVLSSTDYDAEDYIMDYEEFLHYKGV